MSTHEKTILSSLRGMALLSLTALSACGTPLIGGECAEGYMLIDDHCVAECRSGYERRDDYCRLATGEAVILGLDLADARPGDIPSRLLGNAVFLSDHEPVRILDYRELSAWNSSSVSNTVDLIAAEGLGRRRTMTTHVAASASEVTSLLDIAQTDVLFLHDADQAPPGALAELGAAWAGPIDAFLQQRGIVVVMASAGGTNEMGAFLDASGLLQGAKMVEATGEKLYLSAGSDVLSSGIPELIPSPLRCASFASSSPPEPDLTYVVVTGEGRPVVSRRTGIHTLVVAEP